MTSEDFEVRSGHLEGYKYLKSVSLIEPVILILNMTYLHGKNFLVIFEVTVDLGGL